MLPHLKALGIKWIFTTIILFSLLPVFETVSMPQIILMSLIITGLAYVIGDLIVLPIFGNVVASIVDFGLAFIFVWSMSAILIEQSAVIVLMAAAGAYFFTLCEAIFHIYMKERILPKKQAAIIPFPKSNLQTEFSEELTKHEEKKKEDD